MTIEEMREQFATDRKAADSYKPDGCLHFFEFNTHHLQTTVLYFITEQSIQRAFREIHADGRIYVSTAQVATRE